VQNLIKGMSQRQAYRAAYQAGKMTDKSVDEAASHLLKNSKVSARLAELQSAVREQGEREAIATALEVLEELSNIGLGRRQYPTVDQFGKEHMSPVPMANRVRALETLAKYHGLLTERLNLSGAATVEIIDDLGDGDG